MKKPPLPPVVRQLTLVIETAPHHRRPRIRAWRLEWLIDDPPAWPPLRKTAQQPRARKRKTAPRS